MRNSANDHPRRPPRSARWVAALVAAWAALNSARAADGDVPWVNFHERNEFSHEDFSSAALLKEGQIGIVEGRRYLVKKVLKRVEDFGYDVYLVQRLDASGSPLSIIKTDPYATRASRPASGLTKERETLERQRKFLPAPRVLFMSREGLILEKEFVPGELMDDWFRGQLRDRPLEESARRMIATDEFLDAVAKHRLYFDDAKGDNAVFRLGDGKLVVFDGGSLRAGSKPRAPTAERPLTKYWFLNDLLHGTPFYYLWRITAEERKASGGHPSPERIAARMANAGTTFEELFRSIYALNELHLREPRLHRQLVDATLHSDPKYYRALEPNYPNSPVQAGLADEVTRYLAAEGRTEAETLALAATIYRQGLPGAEELRQAGLTRAKVFAALAKRTASAALECVARFGRLRAMP